MAKRNLHEEFRVGELSHEAKSITIHARVGELTAIKQGQNGKFFAVWLHEGDKLCRMAGFEEEQRKELMHWKEENKPVKIKDVVVQKDDFLHDGFQLKMNWHTKIELSDWNIEVPKECQIKTVEVAIQEKAHNFNLHVKVVKSKGTRKVETKTGKMINREILEIADKSGTAELVLWDGSTGRLKIGECVFLSHIRTHEYNNNINFNFTEMTEVIEKPFTEKEDVKIESITGPIMYAKLKKVLSCGKCNGDVLLSCSHVYKCQNAKCGRTMREVNILQKTVAEIEIKCGTEIENIVIDEAKIWSLLHQPKNDQLSYTQIEALLVQVDFK